MRVAVPVGVDLGVGQAIVGAQVDDPHAALAQGGHDSHARGMRQRQERERCALGDPVGVENLAGEVDPPCQAGMQHIQPRRLVLTRRRGRDPDVRMAQQDPDQLARRISRRPHDRHADFRRHVMPRSRSRPGTDLPRQVLKCRENRRQHPGEPRDSRDRGPLRHVARIVF